jgi:hypothetical protein
MFNTVKAVIRQGHIELLNHIEIPEGTEVLVTILSSEDGDFWTGASQSSLDSIWNNSEDDVYEQLLTR